MATRAAVAWSLGWLFSAALYLLLIDITDEPELLVGAGAAILAATALELVREQGVVGEGLRIRWLARSYRPLLRIPVDIALVSFAAIRQLGRRESARGVFRVTPFRSAESEPLKLGQHGLALGFGSLAPNTIVIGVDEQRELILVHQLIERGGRAAIDVLELG
jgi:hypothetical protein